MEALIVKPRSFDDRLMWDILPAFDGDERQSGAVAEMVRADFANAWTVVNAAGEVCGVYVSKFDGIEYEIIAAVGRSHDVNLTDDVLPEIEIHAKTLGAFGIRVNTFRPGLIKKLVKNGYHAMHINLWKALPTNG